MGQMPISVSDIHGTGIDTFIDVSRPSVVYGCAILIWGQPCHGFEQAGEMLRIAESEIIGYFTDCFVCVMQIVLGFADC